MNILYLIPPLALLGYVTFKRTRYGLYCILATIPAFLLRAQIWFVPTTWLELAIYTVAIISLIKHIRRKTLVPHWYYTLHALQLYVIPIALLCIALLLSIIVSKTRAESFGIVKAWFFDPIVFGILFIDSVQTRLTMKKCLFALSLSAVPITLHGIAEYILGINMTIPGRLDSFFSSPNYAAMYLVPLVVFFAGYMAQEYRDQTRENWLSICYKVFWFSTAITAIALTKSFGGWFGLVGGIIALILFQMRINARKICIGIASFALITTAGFFAYQKSFSHYNAFFHINSLDARKELWTNTLTLGTTHPFFGIGLGNFQQSYTDFISSLPREKQPTELIVLRPHNVFLDFWLETGLIGLTAFSWILVIFFKNTLKTVASRHTSLAPNAAAMLALLLHGILDTPYFKNDLALLFWFMIVSSCATYISAGAHSPEVTISHTSHSPQT